MIYFWRNIVEKNTRLWASLMALSAVILYSTGFLICEQIYPDIQDIAKWRLLRDTLSGTVYLFLVWCYALPKTAISRASIVAFIVLAMGDMLDRWVFGVASFQVNDIIIIIGAVFAFYRTYKRNVSKPKQRRME